MKNKEINIFIENDLEDFEEKTDLKEIIDDGRKMLEHFLSNTKLVEKSCLQGFEFDTISFDVLLCGNERIHEINRDYRDKDRPTDVITFAIFADSTPEERFVFDDEINLGEIIISLEKTKQQAIENRHSFKEELYFLFAHGILHLLGYDHMTEETLEEMWDIQTKMTGAVNV